MEVKVPVGFENRISKATVSAFFVNQSTELKLQVLESDIQAQRHAILKSFAGPDRATPAGDDAIKRTTVSGRDAGPDAPRPRGLHAEERVAHTFENRLRVSA